ncbi:polyprenyl synthetase family protein [Actinokineospora auranticolor]|uniref:Geranylgeranyl diphosphate synthase type I n=1 Tax=Actinokineospora auranticolor TaxID=155976 RepID=A0A2S6GLL4_9PSEU|nr:polyprenyl synthetase family protein [Actinokineospora auranticolor]PPK66117.1 geranylgeranyl diphosphate synthase type I [Actinokineospora auranticolor]
MSTAIRAEVPSEAARWQARVRVEVMREVGGFVAARCAEHVAVPDAGELAAVLTGFAAGGKYVRSAFFLAGWSCVAEPTPAAVRAAGSLELLHCFALLQDDVMDGSALRRGRPAAHVVFAEWHRREGLSGCADRFGESAAVLAGDLCLVWSEQMLRESGVDGAALGRAMRRYDRMRSDLAVGQFRDLVNDSRRLPALDDVRDVARAKSGDYTVRGPLELGAELAGAAEGQLDALGRYGRVVGEAFQLRDDLLGLFGSTEVTGKPVGEDLRARKATAVVVLARERADPAARRELARLDGLDRLTDDDVERYLRVLAATGAREWAERLIGQRLAEGIAALSRVPLPDPARDRLLHLAHSCGSRSH